MALIPPEIVVLPRGTILARVYYAQSAHPTSWSHFRYFGPVNARWDHHLVNGQGDPFVQERGIYYAARSGKTSIAEFFQNTRRIDRHFQAPWLAVFETQADLLLLDLTGAFATRMGASIAIHSGSRARARGWARDIYEAYPSIHGIDYASSMHGGETAVALNERAIETRFLPRFPVLNRALADSALLIALKNAALAVGYTLI